MKLISQTSLQIQKPIQEVFNGIVNPNHLTKYFISESNGPLESGKELTWKFPEFDEIFPVTDIIVKSNNFISFIWDPETIVTIKLESLPDTSTIVHVTEDGKEFNEKNLEWLIHNAAGWANFLACLKAYLEYGINLRKGAFDFMSNS